MSRKVTIDETDAKILEQFQQDSTITNKDLAELVGLSPPPTLVRVRNLTEQGFIKGSVATIDWERLGFGFQATVSMNIQKGDVPIFESLMAETEGLVELRRVHKYERIPRNMVNYIARCVFRTHEDFARVWGGMIGQCRYNMDFDLFRFEERIIENKVVPIDRMNIG